MKLSVDARLSPAQNELLRRKLAAIDLEHEWSADPEPDLLYLCGLPATGLMDRYIPLAAPLLPSERYAGNPWYFVDVVGRVGDQDDQRWAFNERESFSGWLAVQQGLTDDNRSLDDIKWVKTGSHLASLEAVRSGKADRAGIDSMVIDLEPGLLSGLEVVSTWGPWPAPPLLAARHIQDRIDELRSSFESKAGGTWISLTADHVAPIASLAAATSGR